MAVDQRNILNYQANDADHRTFAQGIHDMLVAAGLTQTSDTGQANLTTITRPSGNSVSGFEMFRFNDAEQATLPIFIKVEYGSGNVNTIPGLRLSIGQATNGAGTLTTGAVGILASPLHWSNNVDTVSMVRQAFCCYGNGHLVIAFGMEYTLGRGSVTVIERPKNYDGTITTDGVMFWGVSGYSSSSLVSFMEIERAGGGGPIGQVGSTGVLQWAYEMETQDDIVGADISLLPIPFLVAGNLRWSSMLAFRTTAIAGDVQQSVPVFGVSRNYRTLTNVTAENDVSLAAPYF